jgi:hypothetical protein
VTFETRLLASRAALVGLAVVLAGFALLRRDAVRRVLRDFFSAATSPANLAIYRIVFFSAVFVDFGNDYDPATVDFYARLPAALHTPPEPAGVWARAIAVMPVNPELAARAITLLRVFSFLAMIGLFARASAWMVVLVALYVLGIPQYFGKVNHTHHLLWFATILAASRCADVLSVDALCGAFRRAGRTHGADALEPPGPSRAYALPLRFVWVLIGLIYFFPGLHKAWDGGIDWALSDNFRNRMWEAWYQRDVFADNAWRPVFRLDRYPLLYMPAAAGAIAFELAWVFAIFVRRLRPVAAGVALSFHLGTYLLMKIQFWSLLLNFVTFVDWGRLLRGAGRLLFRHDLRVTYDGTRVGHRRRVAMLQTLDVLGRVQYAPAAGARPAWGGAVARTPLAWPLLPVLWPLTSFGGAPAGDSDGPRRPGSPRVAIAAFSVLLVGNVLFGLKGARDGWPFTCYPTFSRVIGPDIKQTDVIAYDATGAVIDWDHLELKNRFSKSRYSALMKMLGEERDVRKMRAFWRVLAEQNPRFAEARRVEFYAVTYSTEPGPTHRELARAKVWQADLEPANY